jgi:hypothetical protein
MHKTLKAFYVILFSLLVLYTLVWFVYGIFLKNTLIKEISALNANGISITYDKNIALKGYPHKILLNVNQVKIISGQNVLQAEQVSLKGNLLVSKLTIDLLKLQFDNSSNAFSIACEDKTQIQVVLQKSLLLAKTPLQHLWPEIINLSLKNNGMKINQALKLFYETTSTALNVHNQSLAPDNVFSEVSLQIQKEEQKSVHASLVINYLPKFQGMKNIQINFLHLYFPQSGISLEGNISNANNLRNLNGEIKVSLHNYIHILEYLQHQGLIPQGDAMKNVLQKISNADDSAQDLSFSIINNERGDFKIGNMNFAQLLFYYYYHK